MVGGGGGGTGTFACFMKVAAAPHKCVECVCVIGGMRRDSDQFNLVFNLCSLQLLLHPHRCVCGGGWGGVGEGGEDIGVY